MTWLDILNYWTVKKGDTKGTSTFHESVSFWNVRKQGVQVILDLTDSLKRLQVIMTLFSRDTFNWSKVTVKAFEYWHIKSTTFQELTFLILSIFFWRNINMYSDECQIIKCWQYIFTEWITQKKQNFRGVKMTCERWQLHHYVVLHRDCLVY